MRTFWFRWLLLLLIGLVPLAVAAQVSSPEFSGKETSLTRGISLYQEGDFEEAASLLRGFVLQDQDSPSRNLAYLYLARIHAQTGQPQLALEYIRRIEAEKPVTALVLEGALLVAVGDTAEGLQLLTELSPADLEPTDRLLWAGSLGRGLAAAGEPQQALYFLRQGLVSANEDEVRELAAVAHDILKDQLSDADLAEAAFMYAGTTIGYDAQLQQGWRAFAAGDNERAEQLVGLVINGPTSFPFRNDAIYLLERLSGRPWQQRAVGVVLPLSGRYQPFGDLVRRGMELARTRQVAGQTEIKFIYVDSEADPEKASQMVDVLANRERVVGILGPLVGGVAEAAAGKAELNRVPMMTLSQRQGLAETGHYIFRNSLTNQLQVKALVDYAMEVQGLTDFAMLYPQSGLGEAMAQLFREEVELRGGQLIAQQGYPAEATDFRRQIKLIKGEDPDAPEDEELEKLNVAEKIEAERIEEEPEVLPFEAIFIPDYADRVGMLAPQLAFYGIEEVQLLGINGWNDANLLKVAGPYVEGAVFVDGFFRYSPFGFVEEFVNRYFEAYGEEPSILEAQGFDAAGIMLTLLADPRVQTRDDLRLALSRLQNYPGVTGSTSFNFQGDAEKVLFLLQVHKGNIVQLN